MTHSSMANKLKQKEILAAKLQPQRVLASLIPRSNVIRELNSYKQHPKLTTIIAPAGYGKSTLMYQLMESRQNYNEIVSWLSLDNNDNNLNTFSSYILTSYQEAVKGQKKSEHPALADYPNANPKERLTLLFNDIISTDTSVTVILDDFHVLTNTKLFKFVDWILESMPNNMSLVIGSRSSPEIEIIPSLKAKSNLIEIYSNKIKFSLEECKDYFLRDSSIKLSKKTVELLYFKTEGWIAALQLAQLALREQDNPENFVKEFSGTDRDIVNYLGSCVIAQLNEKEKDFLLSTSILERMNGELCALLTGDHNAAQTIAEQEKIGSFIFTLDRSGKWFRYHHLFRELLLSRLTSAHPERHSELCLLAAKWFEDYGSINEAIGYYLKATQYEAAADLISQRVTQLIQYNGQHETLFGWLRELPDKYIYCNAKILVCYIWSLTFTHQFKEAEQSVELFRAKQREGLCGNFSESEQEFIDYSLEILDPMRDVFSGDQMAAREKSAAWLEKWPSAPGYERGCVLGILSAACLHTMEFELGRQFITESSREFHICDAGYGVCWMDCIYAIVCTRQGFISEAREVLEKSLAQSTDTMGKHSYSSAMLSLSLAHVYYEMNEIEEAEKMIDRGFLYIEDHGLPDTCIAGYVTKARLLASRKDYDQALAILIEGERFGREKHIRNFESSIAMERGRLLLHMGKTEAAKTIFANFDSMQMADERATMTPYESMLVNTFQARLLIAQKSPEEALETLKPLINECRDRELNSVLINLLILRARALLDSQEELKALRALESAIGMAAKEGALRVFIDEKKHIKLLLQKLLNARGNSPEFNTDRSTSNFLIALCDSLNIDYSPGDQSDENKKSATNIGEKLTKRESEILSLLEQGLSNQQLADSLFVSLPTLKWHLSNIYGKLGVSNKLQAIKVAQQL